MVGMMDGCISGEDGVEGEETLLCFALLCRQLSDDSNSNAFNDVEATARLYTNAQSQCAAI